MWKSLSHEGISCCKKTKQTKKIPLGVSAKAMGSRGTEDPAAHPGFSVIFIYFPFKFY